MQDSQGTFDEMQNPRSPISNKINDYENRSFGEGAERVFFSLVMSWNVFGPRAVCHLALSNKEWLCGEEKERRWKERVCVCTVCMNLNICMQTAKKNSSSTCISFMLYIQPLVVVGHVLAGFWETCQCEFGLCLFVVVFKGLFLNKDYLKGFISVVPNLYDFLSMAVFNILIIIILYLLLCVFF